MYMYYCNHICIYIYIYMIAFKSPPKPQLGKIMWRQRPWINLLRESSRAASCVEISSHLLFKTSVETWTRPRRF